MRGKPVLENCPFEIADNYGLLNCLAIDGTVGYCSVRLCPRRLNEIREILHQAFNDNLRVYCNFNPELIKVMFDASKRGC